MGVYIKGMEMPKAGRLTLQIGADGSVYAVNRCNITAETYTTEAVHVPPHGDLIDYDFCMENYELLHDDDGNPVYAVRMRDINNAPTIIPAGEEQKRRASE